MTSALTSLSTIYPFCWTTYFCHRISLTTNLTHNINTLLMSSSTIQLPFDILVSFRDSSHIVAKRSTTLTQNMSRENFCERMIVCIYYKYHLLEYQSLLVRRDRVSYLIIYHDILIILSEPCNREVGNRLHQSPIVEKDLIRTWSVN